MTSALVTGGSSGIGLAIARALHGEGYGLTLAARKVERLEAAGQELGAQTLSVDVRDEEACKALVAAHVERFGGLDVLVNSAGVGIGGTIGDLTTKAWDLQQDVNLRGTFLMTHEALPHLRSTRGYVVNLASIAGTIPTPGLAGLRRLEGCGDLADALARPEEAERRRPGDRSLPGLRRHPDGRLDRARGRRDDPPRGLRRAVLSLLRLSPAARVPVIVVERAGDET